jgi:hypothetical protein
MTLGGVDEAVVSGRILIKMRACADPDQDAFPPFDLHLSG